MAIKETYSLYSDQERNKNVFLWNTMLQMNKYSLYGQPKTKTINFTSVLYQDEIQTLDSLMPSITIKVGRTKNNFKSAITFKYLKDK